MHYNTLFQDRNLKNLWGGTSPASDPPDATLPLGASIVALSALGSMRPEFSVSIVGNPNCD